MKGLGRSLALLSLVGLLALAWTVHGAMQVAVGYSAKQLCSAVFVAGLPAEFVEQRDILPRMQILGPLRSLLALETDRSSGLATAALLGVRADAVHLPDRGCALHASGDGVPPLKPVESPAEPADVIPSLRNAVDQAFEEPESAGRNTLALLVAKDGDLLVERYAAPVNAATRLQGWSMNKSLMATWIGIQSQRKTLDPQKTLRELLAGVEGAEEIDPKVTLLHLLQMESGLDFKEVYGPGSDVTRMLYVAPAMWTVPATRPQAHAPGQHFAYSSGDTVLASYLWQRSLDRPYPQWIDEHFSRPLGIRSLVAEADASGVQVGSSYAYLTARDWLAAGQLWLDAWHGRSQLLDQRWLRDSVSPRESDALGRYGRGFWLNSDGVAFPGLPENLFYAGGNSGQYVVVIPELELVVVRLGLSDASADTGMHQLLEEILAKTADAP